MRMLTKDRNHRPKRTILRSTWCTNAATPFVSSGIIRIAEEEEEGTMVEVNTRGKSGGCSVGSCFGYFVYFSILVAVAVVGELVLAHLVHQILSAIGGPDSFIHSHVHCSPFHHLVFDMNCSISRYSIDRPRRIHALLSFWCNLHQLYLSITNYLLTRPYNIRHT